MRFVFVAIIWVVILGGMLWYTDYREKSKPAALVQTSLNSKETEFILCELFLTTTFSAEADPFSLQLGDEKTNSDLLFRLNGELIDTYLSPFKRGQAQSMNLEQVRIGKNEIYLQISPPFNESELNTGVRLLLVDINGLTIFDQTIWAEPGAVISELLSFTIKRDNMGDDHDH